MTTETGTPGGPGTALAEPGWQRRPDDPYEISYWDGEEFVLHMRWVNGRWARFPGPGWWPTPDGRWYPPAAAAPEPVTEPALEAPAPSRARGRRRGVVLLVVLLLVAAAAGAGAYVEFVRPSASPASTGLATKTPLEVLGLSLMGARATGSVHLDETDNGASSVHGTYDVATRQGVQTISGGDQGNARFVVLPSIAYVDADAAFLQNALGMPALEALHYGGQWLSVGPGDPIYAQIVSGVTLPSALRESTPTGHLTMARATFDGRAVMAVRGGLPKDATSSGATGTTTLYVSTTAPYLPVAVVEHGTVAGQSGTTTIRFSAWHEVVTAPVPTGATPIGTIPGATAAS